MSLFAGHKTEFLTYYIVLADPDAVAKFQAQYPQGVWRAPYDPNVNGTGTIGGASVEFGAPWKGFSKTDPKGAAPYSWTTFHVAPGDATPFPTNVKTFTRHSGGFWGIGGTDTTYDWIGQFVLYDPSTKNGAAPVVTSIAKRRWVEGFEVPGANVVAATGNAAGVYVSRDAARAVGGLGLALRSPNTSITVQLNKFGGSSGLKGSWERFYVRLRRKPDTAVGIWTTQSTISASCGVELQILPDGHIGIFNVDQFSVHTQIGTVSTPLTEWTGLADDHAWHRIDMLVVNGGASAITIGGGSYGNHAADDNGGFFRLYFDGVLAAELNGPALSVGIGQRSTVQVSSLLGKTGGSAASNLELDIDDWMNAEIPLAIIPAPPAVGGVLQFSDQGKDFLSGSRVSLLRAKSFGAHNDASWAAGGAYQTTIQNPGNVSSTAASLTSAVANAILEVLADGDVVIDADPTTLGVSSMAVSVQSTRGATSGKLGFLPGVGAAVDTAIVEAGARGYNTVLYTLDGTTPAFTKITPLGLRYTKGNAADAATVQTLLAQIELIGIWGKADYRKTEQKTTDPVATPITFEGFVGQHNAPYPRSVYAHQGKAPPISPYIIKAGTYVGNGTAQELLFRAPVHLVYIRNVATHTGFWWWSTMTAAHLLFQEGFEAELVDAQEDVAFVAGAGVDAQQESYRIRITGSNAALNQLAATYQFIAVSDPGMRFMLNATLSHNQGITVDHPLINKDFTPEFAFLWMETFTNTNTGRLHAKGLGNAAASIAAFTGAVIANALQFFTGKLTIQTALPAVASVPTMPVSLWRRHDGNNDSGEGATFAHGSWVGDGSAARAVTFGATGKRPIFVVVIGEAGNGAVRDVSHTGTNSTTAGNANTVTGITAGGLDSFTVGLALNAAGVNYDYFVLVGDATAGNGGFGVNGEFIPVEANSPVDGPWPTAPTEAQLLAADAGTTGTTPTATIPDDITTDLLAACKPFTTAIANLALSRIGVSKKIVDLATDVTEEAETIRTHLGIDIGQTLRDFPWPFATRYATLVLVAGTSTVPVNPDWQYSYRAPADMIYARRLCARGGQQRHYDATPADFRQGSDDLGNLIYTNEAGDAVPVVLEYTVRLSCPASSGDPLFRSALAWRLASSIGPALSRDTNKWKDCATAYQITLEAAKAAAASEKQDDHDGDADWIGGRN